MCLIECSLATMASSLRKRNVNLLRLVEEKAILKKAEEEEMKQQIPHLPEDCVQNIFIHLPIQFLSRMRFVCKPWRSIVNNTNFINSHLDISETVLIYVKSHPRYSPPLDEPNMFSVEKSLLKRDPLSIFGPRIEASPKFYLQCVEIEERKSVVHEYNISCSGRVRASCNGLILVDNKLKKGGLILMNPVTRKLVDLPVGTISSAVDESYGFVMSEVSDEYKLVHLFLDRLRYVGCEILSLGAAKRVWREVDGPSSRHFQRFDHNPVSAIGAIHWLPQNHVDYVVSMEVESEKFRTVNLPKTGQCRDRIMEKDGFLCFVACEENLDIDLWMLKGLSGENWVKSYSIPNVFVHMVPLFVMKCSGDIVFAGKEDGLMYVYSFEHMTMTKVAGKNGGFLVPGSFVPHVNSLVSWEQTRENHSEENMV